VDAELETNIRKVNTQRKLNIILMIYIDPVCKKKLHKKAAYAIVKYQGTAYHLCCSECKDAFDNNPEKYRVRESGHEQQDNDALSSITDPVCGKRLRAQHHTLFTKYKGREYRFCSKKCLEQFKVNPERYAHVQSETIPPSPVEAGAN